MFVKCHFDYDPATDSLIPCKEAGLKFMAGDLLQIVNQDDPNWWQVRGTLEARSGGVVALSPPPGPWRESGRWGWGGFWGRSRGPCGFGVCLGESL